MPSILYYTKAGLCGPALRFFSVVFLLLFLASVEYDDLFVIDDPSDVDAMLIDDQQRYSSDDRGDIDVCSGADEIDRNGYHGAQRS